MTDDTQLTPRQIFERMSAIDQRAVLDAFVLVFVTWTTAQKTQSVVNPIQQSPIERFNWN